MVKHSTSIDRNKLVEVKSIPEGYILDYIDQKPRNYTPEEYVRQNIEKRLVLEHDYSPEQIRVEMLIKSGSGQKKRVDLAIFDESAEKIEENINIIIECKKDNIEPSDKKEGIAQLKSYMAACLNCEWGMWTNGKFKNVFRKIKLADGRQSYEEFNDIPSKNRSISEVDRPTRGSLINATEDNLLFSFKTSHNFIYANEGLQKQPAFFELLKIIFCKISDEKEDIKPLEFYATSKEKRSPDGRLTVKNRISKIFDKVKKKYPTIFDEFDELNLKPKTIAYIISELQKYNFIDTIVDVKGKAYEEIVGANLRGARGEFFTPRNIQRMVIKMLDIPTEKTILDPACGTGGFLIIAMNNIIDKIQKKYEKAFGRKREEWDNKQDGKFQERINEIAEKNFFGFDINPDLVKATKMNMVMNNDGSGNILQSDSLLPPHEMSDEIKDRLCDKFGLKKGSITSPKDLALFDFIVTNPPFGSKIPIPDTNVLEQFDLGYIWAKDETGKLFKTKKLHKSRPPEVLFIERCWQFLVPGGIMGIVVPDAILNAPGIDYASIREWIIQHCKVIASIDLHRDTFQPGNGTKTSVLFLKKKTEKDIEKDKELGMNNYKIFFGIINKVGHDKRGNEIYKRDNEGNDILEHDPQILKDWKGKADQAPKTRVRDDETGDVAEIFFDWKKKEGIR